MNETTVVGRVDGVVGEPVFIIAWLELAGVAHPYSKGREVVLVLGDGRRVEVALDDHAVQPQERVTGTWGTIANTPIGRVFRDRAPGDHVHVVIRGSYLIGGDTVAAMGVTLEQTQGAAGYRDQATSVPTKLRATRAARGADEPGALAALSQVLAELRAERPMAPKPLRKPAIRTPGKLPTYALAAFTAVAFAQSSGIGSGWFWVAWQAAIVTVLMWSTRLDSLNAFEIHGGDDVVRSYRGGWAYYLAGLVTFAGLLLIEKATHGLQLRLELVGLHVATALAAITAWMFTNRRALRWLRVVMRAPRLVPPVAEATWGRVDGTLAGAPGQDAIVVHVDRVTSATSSQGTTWRTITLRVAIASTVGELAVTTSGKLAGALTEHAVVIGMPSWRPISGFWTSPSYRATLELASGDPVTLVGHAHFERGGLHFRATGPESLFVVRGDPRRVLAVIRRPLWLLLAVVVGIAASYLATN